MSESKKGMAVASLVLGIIGVIFAFIPIIHYSCFVFGGLSIIFGAVSLAKSKTKVMSAIALVLGIASIVLAIFMISATTIAVVDAIDDAVEEASSELDDMTGENTESILKNDLDVSIGKFKIKESEFIDETELEVTVKNKSSKAASFSIKIEAIDTDGKRIDTDTVYIDALSAGQSQTEKCFTLVTSDKYSKLKTAKFNVIEVSKY